MFLPLRACLALASFCVIAGGGASASPYQDPPTLASQHGRLDVLMVAQPTPVSLGGRPTTLWTYDVCLLPGPGANACPPGSGSASLAGTRLALQPGDQLHVRLVNKLPPLDPSQADHIADDPSLAGNPTNLHVHGFIVEPHRSVGANDPYGDYVFVDVFNSHNLVGPPQVHPGVDVAQDAVEYLYDIGADHPTGLFWYHPHLHGLALNQTSAGMSGPITIGSAPDMCANVICSAAMKAGTVRHLVLKDEQVLADGTIKTQQEPGFCQGAPAGNRRGACPGQLLDPADPSSDYRGGLWFHTVSGQVYPEIAVGASGDVWRIVNASGSASYALSLADQSGGGAIPMQLLEIDGVTVGLSPSTDMDTLATRLAGRATLVRCPGQIIPGFAGMVCVSAINMMPSSRVSVRVVGPAPGQASQRAVLQTATYSTGNDGDTWPQIDLASVTLAPRGPLTPQVLPLADLAASLFSAVDGLLGHATLRLPATGAVVPAESAGALPGVAGSGPAVHLVSMAPTVAVTPGQLDGQVSVPNCTPLPPGHHRKILFGYPTPTTFGLGIVEVDEHGRDIESTRTPVTEFDPSKVSVCVPLKGGNAAYELWELQNITDEDHNFHIHQTKFFRVSGGVLPGTSIPQMLDGATVLMDNVPVPRGVSGGGCSDGTLDAVKSGKCVPSRTFVVIPFKEIGDFVFHCHILEHEDGGMMARIRVVATP